MLSAFDAQRPTIHHDTDSPSACPLSTLPSATFPQLRPCGADIITSTTGTPRTDPMNAEVDYSGQSVNESVD